MKSKSNVIRRDARFSVGFLYRGKWRHELTKAKFDGDITGFDEVKSLMSSTFIVRGSTNRICYMILDASGVNRRIQQQILAVNPYQGTGL